MTRIAIVLMLYVFSSQAVAGLMTRTDVATDVDHLINTLNKAYVGSRFHDPQKMKTTIANLKKLKANHAIKDDVQFCKELYQALKPLPDKHMSIQLGKEIEYRLGTERKKVDVGNNLLKESEGSWKLFKKVTPKGKNVDVVAISSFGTGGDMEDKEWKEFVNMADYLLKQPYFIIDLRGNDGGSFMAFFPWFEKMAPKGKELKYVYQQLQSVEAIDLLIEMQKRQKLHYKDDKTHLEYLDKRIAELEVTRKKAEKKEIPIWSEDEIKAIGRSDTPFKGRIFVLMDTGSRSATEHAIGWFDSSFKTVKIGSQTPGVVHFAMIGLDVLPVSKIQIRLGTHFYPIKYGFIEDTGIIPDILLKNGDNALARALEEIDKI